MGIHLVAVVNMHAPPLLLEPLHNLNLLGQYRPSTRAHAEVNHTLVLFQLLLGFQRDYLVSKLATFEGDADACRYILLQFELELSNTVVKATAIGQCLQCCRPVLLVT